MNTFGKTFFSLLVFGFIGSGIYFGANKGLDIYENTVKQSFKKKISVKPENIRDKQLQVDSWLIGQNGYTFFDTLDDASMSKFIGLNEAVDRSQKSVNRKTSNSKLTKNKNNTIQLKNRTLDKSLKSTNSNNDIPAKISSFESGFVLQVGSFKTLNRANLLKANLAKKGYLVFVMSAQLSEGDEVWHRVVIGAYPGKEAAVVAAINIQKKENLDSVLMWQENLSMLRN